MSRWLPSIQGVGRVKIEADGNNNKASSGNDLAWVALEVCCILI